MARKKNIYSIFAIRWLLVSFLLILMVFPQEGGGNPAARLATTAALITEHTFAIIHFPWTQDWAKSPVNEKLYSNKPPGPSIIAVPFFATINQLVFVQPASERVHREQLHRDRHTYNRMLSLLLQALPYCVVTILAVQWMATQGIPPIATQFGALALLFGTTASLFMNSYFGHGMAAMLLLAATLAFLHKQLAVSGFLLGWAALSDYGVVLVIIPFVISVCLVAKRHSLSALGRTLAGALVPTVIWTLYHGLLFGHPFHLASSYSNPAFIGNSAQYQIGGLFSTTFNPRVFMQLIVGPERGLLVTQPWVLITIVMAIVAVISKKIRHAYFVPLCVLGIGGLGLLLLFNSSFNGWRGGWTAGPRYLSSILPLFGLLASMIYTTAPRGIRILLWLSLVVSLILFATAYTTTILAPPAPLWLFYWNTITTAQSVQPMVKLLEAIGIMAGAITVSLWHTLKLPNHS